MERREMIPVLVAIITQIVFFSTPPQPQEKPPYTQEHVVHLPAQCSDQQQGTLAGIPQKVQVPNI